VTQRVDAGVDTIRSLDELAALAERHRGAELFVRWSPDIDRDVATGTSRDELTGIELPGLSANSLHVEQWWDGRPLRAWLARRLYDYRHLERRRGPGTRPWVVCGIECGRGPDNEPLIRDCSVLAEIGREILDEVESEIDSLGEKWGSLDRA
jgi:hypothetical protein